MSDSYSLRPFASFADTFISETSWFDQRCHFINDIRPMLQYLLQSQRDYQNESYGLQFFKVWDHVGDRYDDLRNYPSYAQHISRTLCASKIRHLHGTCRLCLISNYQGYVDISATHRAVKALAKLLRTEEKKLWWTASEKISRVITAVSRHETRTWYHTECSPKKGMEVFVWTPSSQSSAPIGETLDCYL